VWINNRYRHGANNTRIDRDIGRTKSATTKKTEKGIGNIDREEEERKVGGCERGQTSRVGHELKLEANVSPGGVDGKYRIAPAESSWGEEETGGF